VWATAAYAAVIFYLSVVPVPEGPEVPFLDKTVHLGEYLVFAWLLIQAIRVSALREREYLLLAWIYATSYGMLLEVIQGLVPWRTADLADAAANAVGAALGAWIGTRFPP